MGRSVIAAVGVESCGHRCNLQLGDRASGLLGPFAQTIGALVLQDASWSETDRPSTSQARAARMFFYVLEGMLFWFAVAVWKAVWLLGTARNFDLCFFGTCYYLFFACCFFASLLLFCTPYPANMEVLWYSEFIVVVFQHAIPTMIVGQNRLHHLILQTTKKERTPGRGHLSFKGG